MRQALKNNQRKGPIVKTTTISAPIKGWTSRESITEAKPNTALILDNFFPESDAVRIRRGSLNHATGMTGTIETLMVFTSATAGKMFGCVGANIYDVSASGVVGAAVVASLTNARWQYTMFATTAGQFLVCCNGQDAVRNYDGSSWTSPSITGATSANFIAVTAHKKRLWFVDEATADVYYLPTEAIAGAATKFPVGPYMKKGGYVMAIDTWTVDGGDGLDDRLVIVTSEGELLVYTGTDPSSISSWGLTGAFSTAKPIGRRCLYRVGGDLLLITEEGALPISRVISLDSAVLSQSAITDEVRRAYLDLVQNARTVFGWQMITYPSRNMAILNIPGANAEPTCQFVLNTTTGAWARFTNLNASCWAYFNDAIYYGMSAVVVRAEYGISDNLTPIPCACLPSYNDLGHKGVLKHIKMIRPLYSTDVPGLVPDLTIGVDYETPDRGSSASDVSDVFFTWDVSLWDGEHVWLGYALTRAWRGSSNIGTVISPYLFLNVDSTTAGSTARWRLTGFDMVYELGGVL